MVCWRLVEVGQVAAQTHSIHDSPSQDMSPARNFVTHFFGKLRDKVLAAVFAAAGLDVRGTGLPVSQAVWQPAHRMKLGTAVALLVCDS